VDWRTRSISTARQIVQHAGFHRGAVRIFACSGPGIALDDCRRLLRLPLVPRTLNPDSRLLLFEFFLRPLALAQHRLVSFHPRKLS
jgi:hypothetical protein